MKTAKVRTTVVSIECPSCEEFQTNVEDGSHDFQGEDYTPGAVMACQHCGEKFRIAKTVEVS